MWTAAKGRLNTLSTPVKCYVIRSAPPRCASLPAVVRVPIEAIVDAQRWRAEPGLLYAVPARLEGHEAGRRAALDGGAGPASGGHCRRSQAHGRRNREAREWEEAGGKQQNPSVFIEEILPLIQPLATSLLTRATGLSRNYCLEVRSGRYVPHPRHWEAFRRAPGDATGQ
jgi:hypothetical protein